MKINKCRTLKSHERVHRIDQIYTGYKKYFIECHIEANLKAKQKSEMQMPREGIFS